MEKIANHAEQALARFIEQFKGKANLVALINAFASSKQATEDAMWDLYSLRWLDNATGYRLDIIGKIVGEPRGNSADDAEFRMRIAARVRCNLSNGTIPDVLSVFKALRGSLVGTKLVESFPAGIALTFSGLAPISDAVAAFYGKFLKAARAAGVYATLQWQTSSDADTFTCDDVVAFVTMAQNIGAGVTLRVQGDLTRFDTAGDLLIDGWGPESQEATYTGRTADTFTGVTITDFNVPVGATVRPLAAVSAIPPALEPADTGFSNTLQVVGGKLAGAMGV